MSNKSFQRGRILFVFEVWILNFVPVWLSYTVSIVFVFCFFQSEKNQRGPTAAAFGFAVLADWFQCWKNIQIFPKILLYPYQVCLPIQWVTCPSILGWLMKPSWFRGTQAAQIERSILLFHLLPGTMFLLKFTLRFSLCTICMTRCFSLTGCFCILKMKIFITKV